MKKIKELANPTIETRLAEFSDCSSIAKDWEEKAKTIKVTDENQTADMKMARIGRLELKKKRCDIENIRKRLIKEVKKKGNEDAAQINDTAGKLIALIFPIEKYLIEQEDFVKIREAKKEEKERIEFEKFQAEKRRKEEAAAEAERIRIYAENERLKKKALIQEKKALENKKIADEKLRIEQKKRETELTEQKRLANIEKINLQKEKRIAEDKLKCEREVNEKKIRIEREKNNQKLAAKRIIQNKQIVLEKAKTEKAIQEAKTLREMQASSKFKKQYLVKCPQCFFVFNPKI